ncbi:MAG: NAD(P)H-hydrate dehydratase [Nitrososphaerota archaeon]|nr:NAD(P)H-hydrate dehydratase [Candidatus Bathyarchaeota archaeon]MDW8048408.1 NAD(P)H-hydrate dehydratase [Nitrososphaerota archaeon]
MVKVNIITSKEMQALEINAEYYGIPRILLMENAGRNVALEVASRFKPSDARVAIFCGLGGNGGDGSVAARHLACMGFRTTVVLAGRFHDISCEEAKINWQALKPLKRSITIHEVDDSSLIPNIEAEVVIDALLGTGLKGPPRPPISNIIQIINKMDAFKVAVDIPSGVDSETGEVKGEAVKADLTVTFHKLKPGILRAKEYTGDCVVRDIGVPEELEMYAGPGDVFAISKPRKPEARKGDHGRLLIIGGSETYSGAPTLAALAALRTGVDLVFIAAPSKTAYAISSISPDLITIKLEGEHLNTGNISVLRHHLNKVSAVIIGPGLGLHKETVETVKEILTIGEEKKIPILLDADGLKAFAEFKHALKTPTVLTPHTGEYEILTGRKIFGDLDERAKAVQQTAQDLDAVVLLKSHVDIISDGYKTKFNFTGNPGMTVGGTGDVLSGIVGAFLARGIHPFEAAVASAYINGAAGDLVEEEKGHHMTATDLIEYIPKVIDDPMCHLELRKRKTNPS